MGAFTGSVQVNFNCHLTNNTLNSLYCLLTGYISMYFFTFFSTRLLSLNCQLFPPGQVACHETKNISVQIHKTVSDWFKFIPPCIFCQSTESAHQFCTVWFSCLPLWFGLAHVLRCSAHNLLVLRDEIGILFLGDNADICPTIW